MTTFFAKCKFLKISFLFLLISATLPLSGQELFEVESPLQSYSISFENPTGAKGEGGKAASPLGVGRKGLPAKIIPAGQEIELANIQGNGTIRHIWMTTFQNPVILRSVIIRVYWEGQSHPSIEVPWGDFFGFAHGFTPAFESAAHSIGRRAGMNAYLPMPFTKSARITFSNEAAFPVPLFYQIDYTLGDKHPENIGRMHILFKRSLKTTLKQDFEILPKRTGKGRYIGTVLGIRVEDDKWWGEGEVKMYMDGDKDFPTIAGTGAEDYVGLSWGMQETPFQYHGANLNRDGFTSMYRWHLKDPIFWKEDIRITIQQIGHRGESSDPADYFNQLYERQDDWSATSFWYEKIPSAPLPSLPSIEIRTAYLYKEAAKTTASKATLLKTIEAFNMAFKNSDVEKLTTMITDNYQHTNGNAKAIDKKTWLNYLQKRNKEIESGDLVVNKYEMSESAIEIFEDMAILTAKITVGTTKAEKYQENEYRVTNIWVLEKGSWKRAGFHDGKIR